VGREYDVLGENGVGTDIRHVHRIPSKASGGQGFASLSQNRILTRFRQNQPALVMSATTDNGSNFTEQGVNGACVVMDSSDGYSIFSHVSQVG